MNQTATSRVETSSGPFFGGSEDATEAWEPNVSHRGKLKDALLPRAREKPTKTVFWSTVERGTVADRDMSQFAMGRRRTAGNGTLRRACISRC